MAGPQSSDPNTPAVEAPMVRQAQAFHADRLIKEVFQHLPEDTRARLTLHDADVIRTTIVEKLASANIIGRSRAREGFDAVTEKLLDEVDPELRAQMEAGIREAGSPEAWANQMIKAMGDKPANE